ncbi:hypothetical protein FCM35_KLT12026 [Carex littledalei]|uniref:Uncharacterized protein n=1 Tax=Carex littledalei TaxID=544730 RepID=A0A833VEX1_9POAL|nr:hypothetical protein FCM35_KLT12026 [Carex littledalei]
MEIADLSQEFENMEIAALSQEFETESQEFWDHELRDRWGEIEISSQFEGTVFIGVSELETERQWWENNERHIWAWY